MKRRRPYIFVGLSREFKWKLHLKYLKHLKSKSMHYRNGKEAKNGDKIVQLGENGKITAVGVLYDATPGNDYCNGYIAPTQHPNTTACLCDCILVEDVAEFLKEKGLEKRPEGK